MFPSLQPSRPRPPQPSSLPTYGHQQRRAYEPSPPQPSPPNPQPQPSQTSAPPKPRSQIEAMPPFGPPHTPASFFTPVYDSAIQHPVFFTQNLKKPPFPIPQAASQEWSPVASGYIMERGRAEEVGRTKL